MKKTICLVLTLFVFALLSCSAYAAEIDAPAAAESLHSLGLLAGAGTNADGSIDFDLMGCLNRSQATTQVVRFLGAEKDALSNQSASPFSDLPDWAAPYVGYAYTNKIVKGVSATAFGAEDKMTDAAFLTLILRVLGYDDTAGDFTWDNPYALAKKTGLVFSDVADRDFTRGDAFLICYRALTAPAKNGNGIKDKLISKGVFTSKQFSEVIESEPESRLYTIDELNVDTTAGSHAEDDINTASLEVNYREIVHLSNDVVGTSVYKDVFYPRIQRVRDDLYLMTYMVGQYGGRELYYATSADGKKWSVPELLWERTEREGGERFTYSEGPLEGSTSSVTAVNPDFCVLQNGEIIAVYYVRPTTSNEKYEPYFKYCGVFIKRGTVNEEDNTITWGKEQQVTRGRGWEPSIHQRPDGRIEIFWTSASPSILKYGAADWSSTCMIYSDDNGYTWTPDIEAWKETDYLYIDIFQQHAGLSPASLTDANGNLVYPGLVQFFKGQMPVVTTLYNGKSMLAVEVRQNMGNQDFFVTVATSGENGEWTPLEYGQDAMEITNAYTIENGASAAAPYISTFPSGEVFLVYSGNKGKLLSPDGQTEGAQFNALPALSNGFWCCCAVLDSHKAVTACRNSEGNETSIIMQTLYLNHRINAKRSTIKVDGYTNDWIDNKDALFVGSESQAQASLRVAHDNDNVYFLISLVDYYLTSEDSVSVCVADSIVSDYRINVKLDGTATLDKYTFGKQESTSRLNGVKTVLKGTVNNNSDMDEGAIIEISIPKSMLAIERDSEFGARLALVNNDGNGYVADTFTGASDIYTEYWPKVVLD